MKILDGIAKYSAHHLATVAECASPDSKTSAGAELLTSVRDAVVEKVKHYLAEGEAADEIVLRHREEIQDDVADGAPSVYTHERWQQFVDLAAYKEDLSGVGTPIDNSLNGWAEIAIFQIAFRLVSNLLDEIQEG